MKASVLVFGCLVLAAPAHAFSHGGVMRAPHPGPGPGQHHRHPHGPGFLGDGLLPVIVEPSAEAAPDRPAPDVVVVPPLPCPVPAAVGGPPPGPHIIYIGHQPVIHGPRVIYGTD
ncbi:MAG: hypothetical protein KGM15_14905 [Pseudomonadota bacterium]|nr:hypothetical protein [Pseudomonadota bacterium]